MIEAATRLKVIGRAGVGVDNVDVKVATQHGIIVMNAPGGSTQTVAELPITPPAITATPRRLELWRPSS